STILNKTRPPEETAILLRWQEKKKKELGEAGFITYIQKNKSLGNQAHALIQHRLVHHSFPEGLSESLLGYCKSVEFLLDHVSHTHSSEQDCTHSFLGYRGRYDSVISFGLVLIYSDFNVLI
ncbi:unnamed protein product, partial [Protopolystoma xenopodis]